MQKLLLGTDFPLPLDRPFTFGQACAAGLSRRGLRRLLDQALLRRLLKGVYVAAQTPDTQLLRAHALQLVVPEGWVVTDESAGWLAGAGMILRPGAHLAAPPLTAFGTGDHDRLRNELVHSGTRALRTRDMTRVHGVLTTTPLRTALDLGRLRHRDRAIAALDELIGLGAFDLEDLRAELPRFRGMRGVRQLRALVPFADGRSESPGESILRLRFSDAGLPIPEPQRDIFDAGGRFLGRADLLLEELRLIAEYDGERWHGEEQAAHDSARRRAMRDAGYEVLVLKRGNLFGPRQDVIQLLNAGVRRARTNLSLPRGT